MTGRELLSALRAKGVRLRLDGTELVCDIPAGVLTNDLRAAIARHKADIIQLLDHGTPSSETLIPRISRAINPPMSFAQQRLWYLDQLEPNSAAYNLPAAFRITGTLDLVVLRRAIQALIDRHEALRATLTVSGDQPVQVIAVDQPIEIPIRRLESEGTDDREEAIARAVRSVAAESFDLAAGPLFRARVLIVDEAEHVLILVAHHAVFDGWSLDIFMKELGALYDAFAKGMPSPLPDLRVQYADYSAWERERMNAGALDGELAYWRELLGGRLPVLQMPSYRSRPPTQTFAGSMHRFEVTEQLVDSLASVAAQQGATLFMVLLAAYQTALHRYTGQTDIVVGVPIANRSGADLDGMIGMLTNTLSLRVDLSGNPDFREVLSRVKEVCLNAYANRQIPFERIVEELHPDRDPSRTPVFQTILGFWDGTAEEIRLGDARAVRMAADANVARTDLSLWLTKARSGFRCALEYNTDLFDPETIGDFAESYRSILEAVVGDAAIDVGRLPVLTAGRAHQVTEVWNDTVRDYDLSVGIHGLVQAQVDLTPNAVAVQCAGEEMTYAGLDARSNQLARYLRKLGVGPNVLVGLCVERSIDLLVALLGILKAGGAYLPLDPEYPRERIEFMLNDAQVPLLVTQSALIDRLPAHDGLVRLDADWPTISKEDEGRIGEGSNRERLAYVIYTSGSTGKPKGVKVPHGGVVNFLRSMRERPGLCGDDILMAVTTLSFDIAALELYLPLTVGGRVVIATRDVVSDGRALLSLLRSSNATAMQATPATWRLLIEAGWGGEGMKVLVGGEALPTGLAAELKGRARSVWNLYGPTETTVWSTVWPVEDLESGVLIGRPIANTQVYILNSLLEPVPVGVTGELYIGGEGVTQGYLNRAELTEERFVANPFRGGRLYRSGDLARHRPDGQIECLGRIDNQVKVRGYRIELGEIESVLMEREGVEQAAVGLHEGQEGDQRLVAYVVLDPFEDPTPTELRRHLRSRLPEYMIPHQYLELDELPLTPNGKIDRKALASRSPLGMDSALTVEPPQTRTEKLVAEIWKEVLGTTVVGTHDNFFDLGGHSLLALRVLGRIESETGRHVPPRLLVLQTLRQIAAEIDRPPA